MAMSFMILGWHNRYLLRGISDLARKRQERYGGSLL